MRQSNLLNYIRSLSKRREIKPSKLRPKLTNLSNIKAILFDVYGCLVSHANNPLYRVTSLDKQIAIYEALKDTGLEKTLPINPEELIDLFESQIKITREKANRIGFKYPEIDIRETWKTIIPNANKIEIEHLALGYECRINPVWPMQNAINTVATLSSRYLLGIISNAQFYTPLILKSFMLEPFFKSEICFWSYQYKIAKPSTKLYNIAADHILRYYGIPSKEILMVGNDMLNDIWTSQKIGFKGVLFAGDQTSLILHKTTKPIPSIPPENIITDFSQLSKILVFS